MKPKIAIVRGKFLNKYEMQFFEPLTSSYDIVGFGSLTSYHKNFTFPVSLLPSPMDLPSFPFKLQILNRVFTDSMYLFGLEEKLRGFDIVHSAETYYRYTQQCLSAKKKGYVKKVIATVLENIPFNNESIWGRKTFKLKARQELDHIIALTNRTKAALLLEGADEKKITVISHFVDTKRFYPSKKMYKENKIQLLFCGRIESYKGVFELVYALKYIFVQKKVSPDLLHLTIVGDGSKKESLKKEISKLHMEKNVSFMNVPYEDMPKMYQAADIYVAPSKATDTWQEQYNTTLLEAQASGLPIVTTQSGGIVENVGATALFAQPADVVSLAENLIRFIESKRLRDEFGAKARERAESVHDIFIGAKKLHSVYKKVLHESS